MFAQESREFHLYGATSCNNGVSLDGSKHNHDSIIERASGLFDVLSGTTSENDSHSLGVVALSEHIVALVSELDFFKLSACSQHAVL